MSERMKITGGVVEIEDGTASGIDFVECEIIFGFESGLQDCTVDAKSTIRLESTIPPLREKRRRGRGGDGL